MAEKLKTAPVLAFERKLDPSDALFFSGGWANIDDPKAQWQGITLREKSVRGTISNRLKASEQDPAKLDAKIDKPNLQTVDVAALPADADTLKASFTLRVLGGAGEPSACSGAEYRKQLGNTVQSYVDKHGFSELARRYACNLANGRFMWRNRMSCEALEVRISRLEQGKITQQWSFNALEIPLREFAVPKDYEKGLQELAGAIEQGLSGASYVLLDISAYARMGRGQEVFPSQELIMDKGSSKGGKSKTLYQVEGIAGMHSQKLGNAIRTIDTWYEDDDYIGPIAVEPYGSVTSQGKAFRQPKQKQDFYSLLDAWVLKGKAPADEQQHYVMATLIRGGVFGDSDKD